MAKDDGSPVAKTPPVPVAPIVGGTWQQVAIRWLFEQGFSSVLLVAILAVSYLGIPKVLIPSINDGYKVNADTLERVMEKETKSNEKIVELIIKNSDSERESLKRAVDAIQKRN